MSKEWRQRMTWAQTRGRTIERQADSLRRALVALASRVGTAAEVASVASAMREQLAIAERLALELESLTLTDALDP